MRVTTVPCELCDTFDTEIEIRFPSELARILGKLKTAVSNGRLKYNSVASSLVAIAQPDFTALEATGPYPDTLHYYFECPKCACMFELTAETYHGSGGRWKRLR